MAKRIQRRRTKGWRLPAGARCVTRPGPFGNPFRRDEKAAAEIGYGDGYGICVDLYREWIRRPDQIDIRNRIRLELRGLDLACYCPLDRPCHADVLIEIANS